MGYDYSKSMNGDELDAKDDLLSKLKTSVIPQNLNIADNKSVINEDDIELEKNTNFLINNLSVLDKRLKILGFFKSDNAKMFIFSVFLCLLMLSSIYVSGIFMFLAMFFIVLGVSNTDIYDTITDKDPGVVAVDMLKKKIWIENQMMLNKMTYMDADIWVENKLLSILTNNACIRENKENLNDYIVRKVSSGVGLRNVLSDLLVSYSNRFLSENKKKYKNILGVVDYYEDVILKDKKKDLT